MRQNASWVTPNLLKTWLVENSTGYIVTYDIENTSPPVPKDFFLGIPRENITQGLLPKGAYLKNSTSRA